MHVDKIFTYAFTLSPQANLQVAGDTTTTNKICANATVEMSVISRSELVINIPWANIHDDKVWGRCCCVCSCTAVLLIPTDLFSSNDMLLTPYTRRT